MTPKRRLVPGQALRVVAQMLGGRISVPLSVLQGRLSGLSEKLTLKLESASPALRVRGEAHALGAPIYFSARIDANGVEVRGESRTIRLRLSEVELWTDDGAPGPLAEAIRGGQIDIAHPATLIGNMTTLPDMVVAAQGSDVVIDLMKAIPAGQRHESLRAVLAAASSYLCVTGIEVIDDALVLRLGLLPGGSKEAALATARAALTPVVRYLWPEGRA